MRVLSCFADRSASPATSSPAPTTRASTTTRAPCGCCTTLAVSPRLRDSPGIWRAGAHTDFDCLTLLFQRDGQGGLQVCPGKEADEQRWTSVRPSSDAITCNIGDMLMRWSDDLLPSNFHRVRMPGAMEYQGARYSLAFFAQANRDVVIAGPGGRYPDITAEEYLGQRIRANFTH